MNWLVLIAAFAAAAYFVLAPAPDATDSGEVAARPGVSQVARERDDAVIENAFETRLGNLQVTGQGTVMKLLADDTDGSRHQRFILRLASGQTLLVAHNIDVAPRVEDLKEGDTVAFRGVYEWSEEGGTIHWTHRDPGGNHSPGRLRHEGRTYE